MSDQTVSVAEPSVLVDQYGRSLKPAKTVKKSASSSGDGFVFDINRAWQGLSTSRMSTALRAEDPLNHHSWVFAAAFATATVASQAPYTVFRETEDQVETRRLRSRRIGRAWMGAPAGKRRMAVHRWMGGSPLGRQNLCRRIRRGAHKSLEPDLDHPVMLALKRPNPFQSQSQLMQMTHLWMDIRGELFWVLTGPDGSPIKPGSFPDQIWPLGPDCFEPMFERGFGGRLIGWWYRPPRFMPEWTGSSQRIPLRLDEVVQFKLPNIHDPIRGMSRLRSVALQLEVDLSIDASTRNTIINDSTPRGLIQTDLPLSPEQQKEFVERWEEVHKGDLNRGRLGMLTDGFKFEQISLTPIEMQFLERMRWDREAILAVMGVPPSVVGLSETTNYATALIQNRHFWDGKIIPLLKLEEDTIDERLFFMEGDDVLGMFDLSDIEALRAGHSDKITMATTLSGEKLHVPPRLAFDVVGLEIEPYEGDDVALVSGLATPIKDVLEGSRLDFAPSPTAGNDGDGTEDPPGEDGDGADNSGGLPESDPVPSPEGDEDSEPVARGSRGAPGVSVPSGKRADRRKRRKASRWRQYVLVQGAMQRAFRRQHRAYVGIEKRDTLSRFDEEIGL